MKNFETATRRAAAAMTNPVDIEFQIDGETLTAHPPTTGQIALFLGGGSDGGMGTIQAMFSFLQVILDEDDYGVVEQALADGVDLMMITEIIEYLIGEWSTRPTPRPSASSASRKSTGKRSTAKPRPKASTT